MGHHVGDVDRSYYRTKDEEQQWKTTRDPLQLLGQWLLDQKWATPDDLLRIEQKAREEIAAGVQFALTAPYPDPSEVTLHVYA